jgi:3-phenylpropionate/trans-cinnamate dioxygenase ferredoxin reductase subunit
MEPRHVDALLIGGGVAAVRCARTLRRRGFSGAILIVGDEPLPPYNRPPLTKELLRESLPRDLVAAEPPEWYERQRVELLNGVPVSSLDPEARLVELADGARLRYGQALLATGAEPRRPAVAGAEHALLLRTLPDAETLRTRAVAGARAVVLGGGFIGVEVAGSLAARGVRVTLLELSGGLWAGSLGPAVSAWAVERLAAAGVDVRLETPVTQIQDRAVVTAAERLSADFVLAGVGVGPRVELAEAAGLTVDNGVVVDASRRTSDPSVFAAGDMARPADGPRIEHWHAAREAGEAAALGMLGAPPAPRRAPWVFSEFGGANLDVVGWAPIWDELVVRDSVHAYVRDGRIAQLAILDGAVPVEAARSFVEREPRISDLGELLASRA